MGEHCNGQFAAVQLLRLGCLKFVRECCNSVLFGCFYFCSGKSRRFWLYSDAARPCPDQSIFVGVAHLDPVFHGG